MHDRRRDIGIAGRYGCRGPGADPLPVWREEGRFALLRARQQAILALADIPQHDPFVGRERESGAVAGTAKRPRSGRALGWSRVSEITGSLAGLLARRHRTPAVVRLTIATASARMPGDARVPVVKVAAGAVRVAASANVPLQHDDPLLRAHAARAITRVRRSADGG